MNNTRQPRIGTGRFLAAFLLAALLILAAALATCDERTAHDPAFPDALPAPTPSRLPPPPLPSSWTPPETVLGSGALPDRHLVRALSLRPPEGLLPATEALWPPVEWVNVLAIDDCESTHGQDPDTYRLDTPSGGRMQIHRASWEAFFLEEYGWTWELVVRDDETNYRAAYIIWQRAGGSWEPWDCRGVTRAH